MIVIFSFFLIIIIIIFIIIINVYIEAKKSTSRSVDNVLEGVIALENEANAAPFTPKRFESRVKQ